MKNKIRKDLEKMADPEYAKFHQKIVNDEIEIIGVRIPQIREYAKQLCKEENALEKYFKEIQDNSQEEIMVKGLLIGYSTKLSWEEAEKYIQLFVPKIRNWALCDTFCSSLKITKKYPKQMWNLIMKYLKSKKEFEVRFSLVMILNYYIQDDYIERIYTIINQVKREEYYIKMANAWLISYCFIKYYDKTLLFYQTNCKVDSWTYHKGIQKAIESYRLSSKQKETLKKLRK